MKIIDIYKIKTKRILFTSSYYHEQYYHERNFWLAQLEPIKNIDELKNAIKEYGCWDKLIDIAKKYKKQIFEYKYFLPAVRQALEIMLNNNEK